VPYWNDTEKRFDTTGDTYLTLDQDSDTISVGADSELQFMINSDGLTLKSGASVNEILDSGDDINAGSTDDQLATAALIYDELEALSSQLVDVISISSDSTAAAGDIALVDTAGGDVTVDLQESANARISVKKSSADGNDVIVTATGTIDGAASVIIDSQYQAITMVCDGTNWWLV